MDTIDVTHWDRYFDSTQQQMVYTGDCYAHFTVQFKQPGLAAGKLNAINTPGMLFTELDIAASQPFCLQDALPEESAESVFVLEGDVESRFDNLHKPLYFGRGEHNIQYNTAFAGTHIIHSRRFHACTITYHRAYLNSLVESEETGALALFCKHLQQKNNFLGATNAIRWQHRIAELIPAILSCPFTGVTRYIFTESKLLELFVLQMDQFHALQLNPAAVYWSPADKEKLYAVKEYIAKAYLEALSLKAITCRFGLNEYKLKKGYKYFFHTTVFGDIHRLRMQEAKQLLHNRVMNVTEAAYYIGYNNVSSFCYAFKKMFGYSAGATPLPPDPC